MTESEQLTEGSWYYCQMCDNDIEMLEWEGDYFLSGDVPLLNNEVESVLAEVPSYEKWEKFRNALADNQIENSNLLIENTKLKELLKECKGLLNCLQINDYDNNGLLVLAKINQVLGEE
jgi:hypothetical protein